MKQETIDALREASDAAKQLQDRGVYHTSMYIPLLGVWRCANVVLAEYDADTARERAHAVDGQPLTGEQMGGCGVERLETTPITSEPTAGDFNFDAIIEEEGGLCDPTHQSGERDSGASSEHTTPCGKLKDGLALIRAAADRESERMDRVCDELVKRLDAADAKMIGLDCRLDMYAPDFRDGLAARVIELETRLMRAERNLEGHKTQMGEMTSTQQDRFRDNASDGNAFVLRFERVEREIAELRAKPNVEMDVDDEIVSLRAKVAELEVWCNEMYGWLSRLGEHVKDLGPYSRTFGKAKQ